MVTTKEQLYKKINTRMKKLNELEVKELLNFVEYLEHKKTKDKKVKKPKNSKTQTQPTLTYKEQQNMIEFQRFFEKILGVEKSSKTSPSKPHNPLIFFEDEENSKTDVSDV